jgi:S1-C subfamily serine protease
MPATLHFTTGVWSGKEIALREPEARIGRDPSLDVVVPPQDQRFVSRVHAAIAREGADYVVRDLESSNGTYVNGTRITRAVLRDGDTIQFGRQGPVARFNCEVAAVAASPSAPGFAVRDGAVRGPLLVPPPPPPSLPLLEPNSQKVRRIVSEALATNVKRSRQRLVAAMAAIIFVGIGSAWAIARYGLFEGPDKAFRRLADAYQGRVVLVEVGVSHNDQYMLLGNGTGFFAAGGGLIVTNKHVVHSHLFNKDNACLAESFRRRGLSYEKALVITVWPGGSEFRQTTKARGGDRGFGYSTEQNTLSLVVTAPDTLAGSLTVQCRDAFSGDPFEYAWRPHAQDNHDLAILRASKAIEPIPMAASEPNTDDDVMVFGFPTGTLPLETNKAEPIRRVGRVLRTRDTIQIDAVVLGGNSGGPLIDLHGQVVGVTTRGPAESLNMAIKVEHVRRLLERAQKPS